MSVAYLKIKKKVDKSSSLTFYLIDEQLKYIATNWCIQGLGLNWNYNKIEPRIKISGHLLFLIICNRMMLYANQ